jgi:Mg2+-importing ATPase
MNSAIHEFWSLPAETLLERLGTSHQGLTGDEARRRVEMYKPSGLTRSRGPSRAWLLLAQYKSPIILILIIASLLSLVLHDLTDAVIILAIIVVSGLLGFWQEVRAADAVRKLLDLVQVKSVVLRDGRETEVAVEEVVPGDVVVLAAGASVPADCLLLEAKDVFVSEAALTGETYPAEKAVGVLPAGTPLAQRRNALFLGTHVISGIATGVAVHVGRNTEFGKVSQRLQSRPPETEFERGLRHFGYFLMEVTLLLVVVIFVVNAYYQRPVLEALLFSLALAVGLTPQLLPAVVSVNLAHGTREMATEKVIVKRLSSIENFGSMNLLCSDKTGTLTEGRIHLDSVFDANGRPSEKAMLYLYLNASLETGFANPMDEAVRQSGQRDITAFTKLDEVPYDFIRKRLSVLVSSGDTSIMISKGAVANILEVCSRVELTGGALEDLSEDIRRQIVELSEAAARNGLRAIAVAYRELGTGRVIGREDEAAMTFLGLATFSDPPKADVAATIGELKRLGVSLKVITGDNRHVAAHVCGQLGIDGRTLLTGAELQWTDDAALVRQVERVTVFAEVEPNQKERIVLALRKAGNVVGFLGDGINDASALHAADVGISVDDAVDVAKEAADIVLLEKDLRVLLNGVKAGRKTFANTLKYVFMATSANFGNMFSMAGASLFLPFLPMLPKQILLTNLLTDFPEMAIAGDRVDPEFVERPHRWDIRFIRRFMVVFGVLSSVFDYATFGTLLFFLRANEEHLRTGWFLESVVSATLIVLVIRTRHPFFRSRPGRYLLAATVLSVSVAVWLPYSPVAGLFGFEPLSGVFLGCLGLIVACYAAAAELAKRIFYRMTAF